MKWWVRFILTEIILIAFVSLMFLALIGMKTMVGWFL